MCIDMGMRFSTNFSHEKFTWKFPVILLVLVLECLCSQEIFFQKFWSLKIWSHRIPRKILEQYYQNSHGQ